MSVPELSRLIKARSVPGELVVIEANAEERAALAARFVLSAVNALEARVSLEAKDSAIHANGTLTASIEQPCAVSGDDFPVSIDEPINLRFVRESTLAETENEDGEIEVDLTADDSDEIEYSGDMFDLGEAIAQTFGLAIDPYAEGPSAQEARSAAGISDEDTPGGPLAEALAALKKD